MTKNPRYEKARPLRMYRGSNATETRFETSGGTVVGYDFDRVEQPFHSVTVHTPKNDHLFIGSRYLPKRRTISISLGSGDDVAVFMTPENAKKLRDRLNVALQHFDATIDEGVDSSDPI